jgi:hypothetical protein
MGIKLYSAMELHNRLLCDQADKAFSPKLIFKPTTAANKQKMSIARFGDYSVMPADFELMQVPVGGFMQDTMAFSRELSNIVASNMSQYRQNLQRKDGNPDTATKVQYDASQQNKLGKTQLNRYYDQLDYLYAEKFRRASNTELNKGNPGGTEALKFQKRCRDRGVPAQAMKDVCVRATRIVGAGSLFERQQSLEFLLGLVSMLPETGRDNLIRQVIASRAGQSSVEAFYPKSPQSKLPTDQHVMAMLQVASMKDGIAPVVSPSQNPVIFAETFLRAGAQALNSVQQGANPMEVMAFLDLCGPAIAAHLDRMAQDPSRKEILKMLTEQFKELSKSTDDLRKMIEQQQEQQAKQQQEMAQAQQRAQAIGNGSDPKVIIDQALARHKMQMDEQKTQAGLMHKEQKARQGATAAVQKMQLADMTTATKIKLQQETAKAKSSGE